uniref:Uncharacterized protein n=1 Tax=Lotharella oceanica TaxID=641309 RepID=A0A7S2XGL8_9EUKA|eukprot:CAMPEP_0170168432 /NCGR_PEP_ID=MMETSP0040_2-20121228/1477_1 /TAXON_ID=641309 /ORGANISM="Lotharella oceanica, Strain CCMP622" /LENGTH=120 /DNA_ID=CAMNT_0010406685 /DNA_START=31 /DNA_END=393 /DNA_ORIENTATION=-
MTEAEYKAFSDRAEHAEKQLLLLTRRIESAEKLMSSGGEKKGRKQVAGSADPAVAKALKIMKDDTIKRLSALKKSMVKAQEYTKKVEEERDALKTENEKLQYRIKHLKRSMEESDKKSSP